MAKGKKKRKDAPEGATDLKFSGGRYESRGFPLDGIEELEKYQRLIVEAAKQIWRANHPDAKRLPRNFADKLRLRLTMINKGSVVPVLERESQLQLKDSPDLLDLSIEYVNATFKGIVERMKLPIDASDEYATAVTLFGGTLRTKEKAVFCANATSPIAYTKETRRDFLNSLKVEKSTDVGTIIGKIRMLDSAQEFILIDIFDKPIAGAFTTNAMFKDLHRAHGLRDDADLVWLTCKYLKSDVDGSILKIEDVEEAGVFADSSNPWALPLAEIAAYPEGWLDGEGSRVELTSLLASLEVLNALSENGLDSPSIFADVEGGVRLEWLTDDAHTVLNVDTDARFSSYHLNIETGEEDSQEDIAGPAAALDAVRRFIGD